MDASDLIVDAFVLLRNSFFTVTMQPVPFDSRPKRNTQDDPLDEYIAKLLDQGLTDAVCYKAPGPLITPDLVLYRPELCDHQPRNRLADDTRRIVAIEVKKLERNATGKIARPTGLDYNTTPPCGTVRIYAADDSPLDIRGYYLFVAQEAVAGDRYAITALALCDGHILNEDFALYLYAVSQREKAIDLGSYGNGVDRQRPMFIFANPLGVEQLDRQATLVTGKLEDERICLAYLITRVSTVGETRQFYAYRSASDISDDWKVQILQDPFPRPNSRVTQTQPRGKFRLPIEVS